MNTDAVIYVIDHHEYYHRGALRNLHLLIPEGSPEGVPILIIANKQDLHPKKFTKLIEDKLMLNDLKCDWRKYILPHLLLSLNYVYDITKYDLFYVPKKLFQLYIDI